MLGGIAVAGLGWRGHPHPVKWDIMHMYPFIGVRMLGGKKARWQIPGVVS